MEVKAETKPSSQALWLPSALTLLLSISSLMAAHCTEEAHLPGPDINMWNLFWVTYVQFRQMACVT